MTHLDYCALARHQPIKAANRICDLEDALRLIASYETPGRGPRPVDRQVLQDIARKALNG